jgi:hypothetical protein
MAIAPIGYSNKSYEDGRKYIAINEPMASIMRESFEDIAAGKHSVEQIWKKARRKGLNCTRSNFWLMVRNPVYCGKIIVPPFKDEPLQIVDAQHQAIITEALFDRAQMVLENRKRPKTQISMPSQLLLRGFLKCPKCSRMLTGSASKGYRARYYYYHCSSACGIRFRADLVNKSLIDELKNYCIRPEFLNVFKLIVREVARNKHGLNENQQIQTEKNIDSQQSKFSRAKELLFSGDLDADDYRDIKQETETKITALRQIMTEIAASSEALNLKIKNIENLMFELFYVYQKASVEQKRMLIDILFPEKLIYTINGLHGSSIYFKFQVLYNLHV